MTKHAFEHVQVQKQISLNLHADHYVLALSTLVNPSLCIEKWGLQEDILVFVISD